MSIITLAEKGKTGDGYQVDEVLPILRKEIPQVKGQTQRPNFFLQEIKRIWEDVVITVSSNPHGIRKQRHSRRLIASSLLRVFISGEDTPSDNLLIDN